MRCTAATNTGVLASPRSETRHWTAKRPKTSCPSAPERSVTVRPSREHTLWSHSYEYRGPPGKETWPWTRTVARLPPGGRARKGGSACFSTALATLERFTCFQIRMHGFIPPWFSMRSAISAARVLLASDSAGCILLPPARPCGRCFGSGNMAIATGRVMR